MNVFGRNIAGAVGLGLALTLAGTADADVYDITVDEIDIDTGDFVKSGVGYNGDQIPTVLRWREGEEVVINVTNNLSESTSIHWHGLILPYTQDGVPGVSFDGIAPGETFTYRFSIVQSGTYWFHSHSGFQEPDGAYGAIVIEPAAGEAFAYERDYVVQLTDKHPHPGSRIMRNLKMMPDYYNRQQRTLLDLFADAAEDGFGNAVEDRLMWGNMRMMPTDIEDVQGYTPLINGIGPDGNWTSIFEPGERIRLRFINSSAMAYFDIRIPGVRMTVVQADGNNVEPVTVDEFRIAVAETYDVIVELPEARPYTIVAESMARTAMARGTLAPQPNMTGEVPALREPLLLTMADMGMAHGDMDHAAMGHGEMPATAGMDGTPMADMPTGEIDHAAMGHAMPDAPGMDGTPMAEMPTGEIDHAAMGHAMPDAPGLDGTPMSDMPAGEIDHAAMGHAMPDAPGMDETPMAEMPAGESDHATMGHTMPDAAAADPFYAPGSGLIPSAANGGKFLSYVDLRATTPLYPDREPTREIELRLTGNMERYTWSINGIKYEDAEPIRLRYGERVRFKFVNETMMTHPMHLHGMWSILDTGKGQYDPLKHVISVAPGTTVYMETEVDAPGEWVFHCHLAYHMTAGMMRKVIVEGGSDDQNAALLPD